MKRTTLNGKYKLYYYDATKISIETPAQLHAENIPCIDAHVPGNVELDLSAAGLLPKDLYFGKNIQLIQQWELFDFWYEREFVLTQEQADCDCSLEFAGVDLIATYFLNGKPVGKSGNMLVEHSFSVRGIARAGKNILSVRLESAVKYAAAKEFPAGLQAMPLNYEAAFLRKAPHSFGWDIMPRAVSCGLWRDVYFAERGEAEIERVYMAVKSLSEDGRRASLYVQYAAKLPPSLWGRAKLCVCGKCGEHEFSAETAMRFNQGSFTMEVENPHLWWPLELGEPDLYDVRVSLTADSGEILSEKSFRFGIRTVDILFSEGEKERNFFQIAVNRVPMFVKGTNWVPADAFHSRDKERLPAMLRELADLRCNMVRCWGGNVYENDIFFDFCDEHGILVWQDFSMACSAYPQTAEFADELAQEVKKVALRLRNHPCLALYCGDNECDLFLCDKGFDPGRNKLTRTVIPDALAAWDPYRRYICSSPYVSPANFKQKKVTALPEDHLWGARDNFKSPYYKDPQVCFIGETGYHGCIGVSSMKKFLPEKSLFLSAKNEDWILHGTSSSNRGVRDENGGRIALMIAQVNEMFGKVPQELQKFSLASQIVQAEALKFFIEYTRQCRPQRTGILWWNLMDGWPQFSDAVIDYYFERKLAYRYIRRSQRPVQLIVKEPADWYSEVIADNVSSQAKKGRFEVTNAETGQTLLIGDFTAPANAGVSLGRIRVSSGEHNLYLLKAELEDCVEYNHYLQGNSPIDLDWYCGVFEKIAREAPEFSLRGVGE